jgi:hypothetical protein
MATGAFPFLAPIHSKEPRPVNTRIGVRRRWPRCSNFIDGLMPFHLMAAAPRIMPGQIRAKPCCGGAALASCRMPTSAKSHRA